MLPSSQARPFSCPWLQRALATMSCTTLQPFWMASSSRRSRGSSRRRASRLSLGRSPQGRRCLSGAPGRGARRVRAARLSLQARERRRRSSSSRQQQCGHRPVCWSRCPGSAASGTACRRRTRVCPLASREGWRPGSNGSSITQQACQPWPACLACRSRPCCRPCCRPSCRSERHPCCLAWASPSWSLQPPWQPPPLQPLRPLPQQAPCPPGAGAPLRTAQQPRSRSSRRRWRSSCRSCRAARRGRWACPGGCLALMQMHVGGRPGVALALSIRSTPHGVAWQLISKQPLQRSSCCTLSLALALQAALVACGRRLGAAELAAAHAACTLPCAGPHAPRPARCGAAE